MVDTYASNCGLNRGVQGDNRNEKQGSCCERSVSEHVVIYEQHVFGRNRYDGTVETPSVVVGSTYGFVLL